MLHQVEPARLLAVSASLPSFSNSYFNFAVTVRIPSFRRDFDRRPWRASGERPARIENGVELALHLSDPAAIKLKRT